MSWAWDPVTLVSLLSCSKARTTRSPCMQHPLTSSTTPRWCSPMACRQRCTLLPSLHLEATGSPWAWWRGPLWPCQQVSPLSWGTCSLSPSWGLGKGELTGALTLGVHFSWPDGSQRTSDSLGKVQLVIFFFTSPPSPSLFLPVETGAWGFEP